MIMMTTLFFVAITCPNLTHFAPDIHFFSHLMSGDNPSCSHGPPVAIGWDYTKITPPQTMHVDTYDYSEYRPSYNEYDLLMDRKEREITLMKLGYTRADLANATRQSLKEKKKRRQTVDNLSVAYVEEKVEERREGAGCSQSATFAKASRQFGFPNSGSSKFKFNVAISGNDLSSKLEFFIA